MRKRVHESYQIVRHNFISIATHSITDMEIMDNPLIEPAVVNLTKDRIMNREETIAAAESAASGKRLNRRIRL